MAGTAIERASSLIQHWEQRLRRDVLIGLEEAARLDTLPIDGCRPDKTVTPNVAERFAALFAESERRLTSASETSSS
jgi:hypothetical protein